MATRYYYEPQRAIELVRHADEPFTYPWHVHAQHAVVVYVAFGSIVFALPAGTYAVKLGETFVVPAGVAHALTVHKGARVYSLCLPANAQHNLVHGVNNNITNVLESPALPHTLEDMAQRAGLSEWHFLRVFKQTVGVTPHAFLLASRVACGRRLVRQGVPVADAALQAGFADQSHFARVFKLHHGVTPRVFQRNSFSIKLE